MSSGKEVLFGTQTELYNALRLAKQTLSDDVLHLKEGPVPRLERLVDIDWSAPNTQRFRRQHVEFLLDQAADLLDRGTRDRQAWDDLEEKRFALALAFREFFALDEIQRKEDQIKHDQMLAEKSKAEASAAKTELSEIKKASKMISDSKANHEQTTAQRATDAMWAYWLPLYNRGNEDITDPSITAGRPSIKMAVVAPTMGHNMALREGTDRLEYLSETESFAKANVERSEGISKAADLKAAFDEHEAGFQAEKRQIARDIQAARLLGSWMEDGALNYSERMKPIEDRFRNDFVQALARLSVAELGMKQIYGYQESLPTVSAAARYKLFDDCLIWVRKAIHFVTEFNRQEQVFFAPISVRRTIGEKSWLAGKGQSVPSWLVGISDVAGPGGGSLFGTLNVGRQARHVRLRGAAVYVESTKGGTWRVSAQPPRSSFVIWRGDNVRRTVDQGDVPALLAMKARNRSTSFQTDILGSSQLHNVAPFGDWDLKIDTESIEGHKLDEVEDIVIDFLVTASMLP